MTERLTTHEHITQPRDSLQAIGHEVLEVVEGEQQRDTAEAERKKRYQENCRRLTKRFGETFMKGARADAAYEGNACRDLLALYLELPNAADHIKRLLPSTRQALQTLRDNSAYIQQELDKMYERQVSAQESCESPYDIARRAGYELTGPFKNVSEFSDYANDTTEDNELCTFEDPYDRLQDYHILWLRRPNLFSIPHARDLTEHTLTEEWKDYLKDTAHYNPATGRFNLSDLSPGRQDPYGTSSMSVQIHRRVNHVSIKNRYNHEAANPDNTYNSNLDEIIPGLRSAVYYLVGREDLLQNQEIEELCEGYVQDNDGGIHRYYDRVGHNLYLGDYTYIQDGVAHAIDRSKYVLLDHGLYAGRHNEAPFVPGGEAPMTSRQVLANGLHELQLHNDKHEPTLRYCYNPNTKETDVHLTVLPANRARNFTNMPTITQLTVAAGAKLNRVEENPRLTTLTVAPKGIIAKSVYDNPLLSEIVVGKRGRIGQVAYNNQLHTLTLASKANAGYVHANERLAAVVAGNHAAIKSIYCNDNLATVTIGQNATVKEISDNWRLKTVTLHKNSWCDAIYSNTSLETVTLHTEAIVDTINSNHCLETITIGEAAAVGQIAWCDSLEELTVGKDGEVEIIKENGVLQRVILQTGASIDQIAKNPQLHTVVIGECAAVHEMTNNRMDTKIAWVTSDGTRTTAQK